MKFIGLIGALLCTLVSFRLCAQVNAAPVFTGGSTRTIHICGGSTLSLDSLLTVTDSNTGQHLAWQVNDTAGHGTATVSATDTATAGGVTPSGTSYVPSTGYFGADYFSVVVTDDSSATDTLRFVIIVDSLPHISLTGRTTLCRYDSATLTPSVTGGSWWSLHTAIATVNASGKVYALAEGTDSVLYAINTVCGGDTALITLTINRIPDVGRITGYDSVCMGSTITLTAAHAGGRWSSSNAFFASVDAAGVVSGNLRGTATITYTMSNSCGSASATHTVDVNMKAQPIIGPTTICALSTTPNLLIELTPNGTWSSSNPLSAIVVGGALFGALPGTSTITYTVNNACGRSTATLDVTVETCKTGIDDPAATATFGVYPNPSQGDLTINIPGSLQSADVMITNAIGVTLQQRKAQGGQALPLHIDVPGVYLVRVSSAGGNYSAVVTVAH